MTAPVISQTTNTPEALFNWVTANAFDFLATGIGEFKEKPKYSVIHFCTGVELFMKARLMREHWSLVAKDTNKADWNDFISGKLETVNLKESFIRLEKIAREKLDNKEVFFNLANHRNRIFHFHHDINHQQNTKVITSVAQEQCRAWYVLRKLLTDQWQNYFQQIQVQINELDRKMKGHQEYLGVVYEELKSEIEAEIKKGQKYEICFSCKHLSAKVIRVLEEPKIYLRNCRVCGFFYDHYLEFDCVDCGKDVIFESGGGVCLTCEKEYDIEAVKDIVSDIPVHSGNYSYTDSEFNCSWCDGYHTVVHHKDHYICLQCFEYSDEIESCGWCGEGSINLQDGSGAFGCSQCEGSVGWHAGKDD